MLERVPDRPWLVIGDDEPDRDSVWVIEHGIPPLPRRFEVGFPVPIARWVDEEVAAALWVTPWIDAEDGPELTSDTDIAYRTAQGWEECNGSGGTGWSWDPAKPPGTQLLDQPGEGRAIRLGHRMELHEQTGLYRSVDGAVAANVVEIEVLHANGLTTRRRVEPPFGTVVVCTKGEGAALVSAVDVSGQVVESTTF